MTTQPFDSEYDDNPFGEYSEGAAESDAAAAKRGADFDKFEVGNNVRRFVPPRKGEASIFKVRYVHPLRDGKEKSYRGVNCPMKATPLPENARCAICDEIEELRANGDTAAANELEPQHSPLALALDLGPKGDRVITAENAANFLRVMDVKRSIHTALTAMRGNAVTGGDYAHPLRGFPVNIEKTDGPQGVRYAVTALRDQRGPIVAPETLRAFADALPSFDNLLAVPTYEETAAILDEWRADVAAAQAAAKTASAKRPGARR